jgi:ATP-dependent Lon protease
MERVFGHEQLRFKSVELDFGQDWYENLDVAVLATYMGVPKEGSSAGITIATGIVSALKKLPVRNDIAITGEITIMGKVIAVGGIQQKIRAAYDAGVKEILLPADNLKEAKELPSYILDTIKLTPVQNVDEALRYALVDTASR